MVTRLRSQTRLQPRPSLGAMLHAEPPADASRFGFVRQLAPRPRLRTWAAMVCLLAMAPTAARAQEGVSPEAPPVPAEQPAAGADTRPAGGDNQPGGMGVIIPIRTDINDVTTESIQRRIDEARAAGARVIIFDIHTPGGYVTSALDISHVIKNTRDIKTVAWVNTQAYSAGALISVACDEIVMAHASTIGDSQVILSGPEGPTAVSEGLAPKVNTPILADFRDSANTNGYDPLLCEAFVLPDREVWWLENVTTGQREFVTRDEKLERLGGRTGLFTLPKLTDGEAEWKLVESFPDIVTGEPIKLRQPVVADYALLQMSASEAHAFGFNKGIAGQESDLAQRYGLSSVARAELNWSEELTMWLTSAWIRGILLVIMLLAAYVEFHTPGVGLAGGVALVCLAIFAGAPYLTGLANSWEIIVIGLGIVLLLIEAFVVPGFGLAGISGIVLLTIGLLGTFVPDVPGRTFPIGSPVSSGIWAFLRNGLMTMTLSAALSVVGMYVMGRYLPEMESLRRFIPLNPTPEETAPADDYRGTIRVGDLGRCETPLRPAGKARFGDVLADVISQADFVERGQPVEIVERHGNVIVVRACTQA